MKRLTTILLLLCAVALVAPAQNTNSRFPQVVTFTIAQFASTSDAKDMGGCTAAALIMPAAFTGTAITFSVAADGGAYQTLYDEYGSAKTITVAASRTIILSPSDFWFGGRMKLVSNGTESAARTVNLVCRN